MNDPLEAGTRQGEEECRGVLICEDEEGVRRVFSEAMRVDGRFRAIPTETAEEAEALLARPGTGIEICVLDLCLPGKSGVDLVEIIKKQWPHLPIVVVTGVRDHDAFLRCLQAGAADFLIKPVKIGQLLQILEEVLHRQARFEESEDGIRGGQLTRDWIELTAPSEMEYLNRLQRFTDVLLLSHFPQDLRDDLRLAFEEIGRNAIEWGNRFDREKMVRISYCVFPDRIVLKFEDEGEGFIPQKLPDPTTDPVAHISGRKSEGKRPGGFGVYLVQKLMDDVVYSDRGNVVLMTKHLPGEA